MANTFKNNKLYKPIYLLFGIIIIGILIYLLYLLFRPLNNVNEEFITEYYSYLGSNELKKCGGLYLYNEERMTQENIRDSQKLCNAYLNLTINDDEKIVLNKEKKYNYCTYQKMNFAVDNYEGDKCTIIKVSKEKMANEIKNIYNTEVGEYQDFNIDDNNICRFKNNYYYCGLRENFVYSLKEMPKVYRSIFKTIEVEVQIEVYDYFLRTFEEKCYYNYISNTEIANCSKKLAQKGEINYSLLKKYGTLYKHVFKKNTETNKYYWVETIPLEK